MFRTTRNDILLRLVSSLVIAVMLCTTLLNETHGQVRNEQIMKRTDLVEAAAVLKALKEGWALVDYAPEIDFLVFVSESRDELDFYPKKSLVQMMETSGLIENTDKESSSTRELSTHYEGGASVWKEVTVAAPIVFQYSVTEKGTKLLRDAPRLIGGSVPALRPATSPVHIQSKPLSVVTYDRKAIQELVNAFEQKATAQIAAAFSPRNDLDLEISSSGFIVCGSMLWRMLESQARRNGLQTSIYSVRRTYRFGTGVKPSETEKVLDDQPIFASGEAPLFWKTLRDKFKIAPPLAIRRATSSEWSTYPYPEEIQNDEFPTPDLAGLTVLFIVENNESKFIVLVKNVPGDNIRHYKPVLSWVEIMPRD